MGSLDRFRFTNIGVALNDGMLDSFEHEIGGALPVEYRRFQLIRNGGVLSPALRSSISALPHEIQVFFALEEGYSGLRRVLGDCEEVLEELASPLRGRLLPIASDTGDRLICIQLGSGQGEMFLLSLHGDAESRLVPLAIDFGKFIASLSQPEHKTLEMEALASQSWEQVRQHIESGGPIVDKDGGLSLLCQTIRCDKPELFAKLMEMEVDTEDAFEVAVLNNRLDMLKVLIEKGGDAHEALDFACGPQREPMRQYLRSVIEQ
jgi:hypothetical protein